MAEERADYDSPWKRALQLYWQPFLTLCFPSIEADIDWTQPFEFLDKELQAVVRDGESGRQYVDKLVKVCRRDGQQQWVLVHLEIQSQPDPELPARIYHYHQRLSDARRLPVASLAVLADVELEWRPQTYGTELWGCRLQFTYPVCKLLDLSDETLEQGRNPIAIVIAAHRAAQQTVGEPLNRRKAKWRLIRRLKEKGFDRQDVLELLQLIDWLIALSPEQEVEFRREWAEFEKENDMPYVSSFEKWAREEGREEGRKEVQLESAREAVRDVLLARFGNVPVDLNEAIQSASDRTRLRQWHRLAVTAASLAAFRESILTSVTAASEISAL